MATTTIDGRTINYTDTGAGAPPILLVHGFGGNLHHFDAQAPALAARHRVVAVDRSGHGGSDTPAGELTVDLYAGELAALCDDLGLDQVVVVQHSFDKPSIELAARHPELVRGLVIVDGPTVPSPEFKAAGLALADTLETDAWQDGIRAFAERWVFPAGVPESAREAVLETVWPVGQRVLASSWRGFVAHDARPALRSLTCPVLYVAGAFPCDLDALAADVPQLQVAELRGRGHMLMFTAPAELTDLIAGFAASVLVASDPRMRG
jgi:pimeloyl-ACP methyl ester carboxylesterase